MIILGRLSGKSWGHLWQKNHGGLRGDLSLKYIFETVLGDLAWNTLLKLLRKMSIEDLSWESLLENILGAALGKMKEISLKNLLDLSPENISMCPLKSPLEIFLWTLKWEAHLELCL